MALLLQVWHAEEQIRRICLSGAAPEAEMVIVKLKEAKEYLREYYFVDRDADAIRKMIW